MLATLQLMAVASNKIFTAITYTASSNTYVFARGSAYFVYIAGFALTLLFSIGLLVANFIKSAKDSQQRRAFKTVLLTIAIAGTYGVVTNAILPVVTNSQRFINLGLFTVDIFAVGLALSIIRYRFLEIRTYVFRTVGYLLTFLIAATVYATLAGLFVGKVFHISLSASAITVLSAITLLVAMSFHSLHQYFNRLTSRLFYQDAYDAQKLLSQLNQALLSTIELDAMLNKALQLIVREMKAEYCAVVLRGDSVERPRIISAGSGKFSLRDVRAIHAQSGSQLDAHAVITASSVEDAHTRKYLTDSNIDALADLSSGEDGHLGHLLFGAKQSGNAYNSQDVGVIHTIAGELVIAIQNALRFEQIQNFNETLEDKIEEATRKLRNSNDKLRKLDETKDDFISMASHQLRTPLTSVKGYVSMVLDGDGGELTPMQRKLLSQSFVSAQRMVYLISDLLNVSRLRTGKFIIEPSPVNLARVVKDEVDQLVETAKSRGVELTFERPEHFPSLMLDDTKIRQVIMNFLDNAIYYTQRGGTIDVRLKDMPKSVELTITDTGIGVPRHEQPHLFTKFYRANNAKRARPDGTGLGLFMAKKVIIAQGGALIFKSVEGKGSTFGFTFAKEKLQPIPKAEAKSV